MSNVLTHVEFVRVIQVWVQRGYFYFYFILIKVLRRNLSEIMAKTVVYCRDTNEKSNHYRNKAIIVIKQY